jgi:hypothetical protein
MAIRLITVRGASHPSLSLPAVNGRVSRGENDE